MTSLLVRDQSQTWLRWFEGETRFALGRKYDEQPLPFRFLDRCVRQLDNRRNRSGADRRNRQTDSNRK